MTPQQIFDTVAAHLRKQGAPAEDVDGSCMYRAPNGRMCAVGCLIPDHLYDPGMENTSIRSLMVGVGGVNYHTLRDVLTKAGLVDHLPLLGALQRVHDDYDPGRWGEKLAAVAEQYGLTYA